MSKPIVNPTWVWNLLGTPVPAEGTTLTCHGQSMKVLNGIPCAQELVSSAQSQTSGVFGYKWKRTETYDKEHVEDRAREWLQEKYGHLEPAKWFSEHGPAPLILDGGCGAGFSALAMFAPVLDRVRYLGVDISEAVHVAAERFSERGLVAGFMQADLTKLPLPPESVDIIFSEGVLHHTDDTRAALAALSRHLKVGGRILFYVYRKKGPVREFTDDYIREKLQGMTPEEGWIALEPLTKLGHALGELDIEIDVPEDINLLNIPSGKISLQRFFYWHVCKMYYRSGWALEEMNHVNFDWFAPKNAHRQTPDEVRTWCAALNLIIEHEKIEEAGITIIAKKSG